MTNGRLQSSQMPADYAAKMRAARKERAMRGERRIITMLFCDVVGSTAMAGQLDPEEWAEIMNEAFEYLITPIYRYEGTVARLLGDAVLAFFGAPIAHEDDPQRAVLAGLAIVEGIQSFAAEIRQEYGLDFNVRVGINTGPVVVGEVGTDLALEYTAMGDAINLASRMESTAEPGTVQITANTYELVAPIFNVQDVGEIIVKGKEDPVQAYCVLGLKPRPGRLRGLGGLKTPLVGRTQELQKLKTLFENLQQGQGQIVCLTGEAGLGKSRLIAELKSSFRNEILFEKIGWIEGHGISYDSSRPYGVIMQMFRQLSGVRNDDPPQIARQKIRERIGSFYHKVSEPMTQALEILLTIEDQAGETGLEGEALKRELFAAFLATWPETTARFPLVAVHDDLHWADPASIELLIHLFQLVSSSRCLFICSFRPYHQAPVMQIQEAASQMYADYFTAINLQPLAGAESTELVNGLMGAKEFPASLRDKILQKADGNPFFIEEVLRAFIDLGDRTAERQSLSLIDIPNNVLSLLVSRIDRLEKGSKQTLQLASVIGRSFYERVLAMICDPTIKLDDQLQELQIMEIILREKGLAEPGYMFRHALTRDAAYGSILRRQRRRYHRRVAESMQQLFAHNLQVEAHRLAYHYHEARDFEQALRYYIMAGDHAARLYANKEAIDLYGRAQEIALTSGTDEDLIYLYPTKGRLYEIGGKYDQAIGEYQALSSLAVERKSEQMKLAALLAESTLRSTYTDKYDPELGRALLDEALALAQVLKDPRAESKIYWNLMLQGTYFDESEKEVVAYGEKAVEIAREGNFKEELAYALNDLARPYSQIGRMDKAAFVLEESGLLWRELGNRPMLADNRATLGSGYAYFGRLHEADHLIQEALQISRAIGNYWGMAYSLNISGSIYMELGRIDEAINAWQTAVPIAGQANFIGAQAFVGIHLGLTYAYLGDTVQGMAYIKEVESWVNELDQDRIVYYPLLAAARLHLYDDVVDAAVKLFEMSMPKIAFLKSDLYLAGLLITIESLIGYAGGSHEAVIKRLDNVIEAYMNMGLWLPWLELMSLKGRGLVELNRLQEAAAVFEQALFMARKIGSQKQQWQILGALANIADSQGRPDEARTLRQEARLIIDFITDHISDPDLKRSFLNLQEVEEIFG